MLIKTSELSGAALDWAVAKSLGWKMIPVPEDVNGENSGSVIAPPDLDDDFRFPPRGKIGQCFFLLNWSTNWAQSGPLLDEFDVWLSSDEGVHSASTHPHVNEYIRTGPTKLIAACRAIVAAKLGDEVEVPDDLLSAPL